MCGPGSRSTVTVDTYPGAEWHGTVESISPAAAQSFSLLPAQNTSGNWVKVVQRIPMRVRVDTSDKSLPPLRAGMSVEVDVDTGHARGLPHFLTALFGSSRAVGDGRRRLRAARSPIAAAITACVILATLMQALDTTIANVALPYMQGSVSASQDQINWVLTSYIVAAAIMTPPTGFLAGRFGRKRLFLVVDRRLHRRLDAVRHGAVAGRRSWRSGCCRACSARRSCRCRRSVLLDIYTPKERRARPWRCSASSVMVGPVLGPVLGGWLTDNTAGAGSSTSTCRSASSPSRHITFCRRRQRNAAAKLDWFGFGTLSLAIGALQIMLDRGEQLDWFGSGEIIDRGHRRGLGLLPVPRPHLHGAASPS